MCNINITNLDMLVLIPVSILIGILLFGVFLLIIDKLFKTHYSCDLFAWHDGKDSRDDANTFDGCSCLAKCSKCGKNVILDSQGNWF